VGVDKLKNGVCITIIHDIIFEYFLFLEMLMENEADKQGYIKNIQAWFSNSDYEQVIMNAVTEKTMQKTKDLLKGTADEDQQDKKIMDFIEKAVSPDQTTFTVEFVAFTKDILLNIYDGLKGAIGGVNIVPQTIDVNDAINKLSGEQLDYFNVFIKEILRLKLENVDLKETSIVRLSASVQGVVGPGGPAGPGGPRFASTVGAIAITGTK
jgi:hypothetical protein